jgi:hypothetical protein
MGGKCNHQDCWAPEIACNMGYPDYRECPHFQGQLGESESSGKAAEGESAYPLPWSGNSFGRVDLQIVSARSKPTIIGVIGSHNAGKTTLLTVMYLLLSRGRQFGDCRFAGSYTLGGWENLAHFLRWKPGQTPSFPPHTSISAGRVPGLLHLSFRRAPGGLEDIIVTDAPGEWFDTWAINKNAAEVAGAQWISRNADSFMLLADSDALSGSSRGDARIHLLNLAERIGSELAGRRLAVVWSKSDIKINDSMRTRLKKSFDRLLPNHREFSVSVTCVEGKHAITEPTFTDLFTWLLREEDGFRDCIPSLPIRRSDDPLLAFRGGHR